MKRTVLILSGWAYPPEAWAPVLRVLAPAWTAKAVGAGEILAGHPPGAPAAALAGRIRPHLPAGGGSLLAGWSLGGMLALQAAAALADRVEGLLLIAATSRFCRDGAPEAGMPPAALRAMALGLRRAPRQTLERFYAASAAPAAPDPRDVARWTAWNLARPDALGAGLAYLRDTDLGDTQDTGGRPVVLLHGHDDTVIPAGAGRALAAGLPGSRLDIVPGTGHDLPLRRPDRVARGLASLVQMGR